MTIRNLPAPMAYSPGNSRALAFACWVTRMDYDVMSISPDADKKRCFFDAALLLLIFVIVTACWTAFFEVSWPLSWALCAGMLIGMVVFLFDQSMGASEWEPGAFLGEGREWRRNWQKYAARFFIAVILSVATATGLTQKIYAGAIADQRQTMVAAQNAPVRTRYAERSAAVEDDYRKRIAELDEERQALVARRGTFLGEAEQARVDRVKREEERDKWRVEKVREQFGDDRPRGPGPKYRTAVEQESVAIAAVERAEARRVAAVSAAESLSDQIAQVDNAIDDLRVELREELERVETTKLADPMWLIGSNDPLSNYIAFIQLRRDPQKGVAVRELHMMLMSLIVVLELSFVLTRCLFRPPSIYWTKMIARTKGLAILESRQLNRLIDDESHSTPVFTITPQFER